MKNRTICLLALRPTDAGEPYISVMEPLILSSKVQKQRLSYRNLWCKYGYLICSLHKVHLKYVLIKYLVVFWSNKKICRYKKRISVFGEKKNFHQNKVHIHYCQNQFKLKLLSYPSFNSHSTYLFGLFKYPWIQK